MWILAAGILLKAGWDGSTDLIDPMCGSGTLLIEAALIARNIAPGIYRKGFAFEQWLDYDATLFEELYNDDSEEVEFEHKIYGSDILPHAIRVSDSNVRRAGVQANVQLDIQAFQDRPSPSSPCLIVMNPPYGERLKLADPRELYAMIGERLKHNYPGCKAWIIAYKTEHFDGIGLKHNTRTELMNGSLECELRSYELFAGKRDEFKRKSRDEQPKDKRSERKARFAGKAMERRRFDERKSGERPKRKSDFRTDKTDNKREERTQSFGRNRQDDARGKKPFNRNERTDHKRLEKPEGRKGLWPSDRFNYTDTEGKVRRRKAPVHIIQTFKSEDK